VFLLSFDHFDAGGVYLCSIGYLTYLTVVQVISNKVLDMANRILDMANKVLDMANKVLDMANGVLEMGFGSFILQVVHMECLM